MSAARSDRERVSRYLNVPLSAISNNSLMLPVVTVKFINGVLIAVGCDVCLPASVPRAGSFHLKMLIW